MKFKVTVLASNEFENEIITRSFDTQKEAEEAIALIKIAIRQGCRCGKVRWTPDLTSVQWDAMTRSEMNALIKKEEADYTLWASLDFGDRDTILKIESFKMVEETDLPF